MIMLYTSGEVNVKTKMGYIKYVLYVASSLYGTCHINSLSTIRAYFCLVDDVGIGLFGGSTRVPSGASTLFLRKRRAFGPWKIKSSVQRDRPRRVSGWWTAAVRSVAKVVVKTILRMET